MFTFKSTNHLALISMKSMRLRLRGFCCLFFFACYLMSSCFSIVFENTPFLHIIAFAHLSKTQLDMFVWAYFWVLSSVPLSYMSVPLPITRESCFLWLHISWSWADRSLPHYFSFSKIFICFTCVCAGYSLLCVLSLVAGSACSSPAAVLGLLLTVASLVAERRLQ